MRQSWKKSSDVIEARRLILCLTSRATNPLVPFSTNKPLVLSPSAFAHTIAISATLPLVIQAFDPFSSHPSLTLSARVLIPAGFEPKFGSVSPKHPSAFPAAIGGSHFLRCSSLPNLYIGYMHIAPCTEAKLRIPESPASRSCITVQSPTLLI